MWTLLKTHMAPVALVLKCGWTVPRRPCGNTTPPDPWFAQPTPRVVRDRFLLAESTMQLISTQCYFLCCCWFSSFFFCLRQEDAKQSSHLISRTRILYIEALQCVAVCCHVLQCVAGDALRCMHVISHTRMRAIHLSRTTFIVTTKKASGSIRLIISTGMWEWENSACN